MSTCGQCYFGKLIPQDLKARACFGAPPAPVALPTPAGVQVRMLRPMVGADDEACSLFRSRAPMELPLPTSVPMTVVTQMNEPIQEPIPMTLRDNAPAPVHKKFAMGVDAQVIKAGSNNIDNAGGA